MSEPSFHVCIVKTPEGEKRYVTPIPPEVVFERGLIPEAIVGALLRSLGPGESITPEIFARNSVFVRFMHEVIAKHAPLDPGCREEAKKSGTGWLFIIDKRTKTPRGDVPPEDIIGAFQVVQGEFVADSYRPNAHHMILSKDGFFRLMPQLHEHLLRELQSRMNA
jgi:hypothetical protein